MKPTIVLFMSSAGTAYGGSEAYTINIIKYLCQNFNVKLILGRGKFTEDFNILIRESPVDILCVPFVSRYSRISNIYKKTIFFKKINDFDIEALTVMLSIKKIKRFISDADIIEVQYPTESLIFPFIEKTFKKIIHFHGYTLPVLYSHLKKRINNFVDACIANSYWSKKVLEEKTGLKDIKVIYNGVDTNLFKPVLNSNFHINAQYDLSLPRVGTVGRLSKAKGIDLLIDVAKDMYGYAEFFAVGPWEENILNKIKNFNVKNFHLLGSLPNKILPNFYNFIDCYVLSSLIESFGITIIEAMACGKPVVASKVGGIPEIIDDHIDGILVEPNDFTSLKGAIEKILKDKNLMVRLGENGMKKVLERFTLKRVYDDLKDFYMKLLN